MARSRGQIRKRGEEKYLIRVYLGRVNGKRKYKSKTVYGDEDHAEEKLTEMLRRKDRGLLRDRDDEQMDSFLDEWLESKEGKIKAATYGSYESIVEEHIRPGLGHLELGDVNSRLVQGFINDLDQEKDLSPVYIRNIHGVLRMVLKKAVRWDLIATNPADASRVDLPSRDQPDHRILDKDEVGALLEATRGDRLYALWALLIATGLRPQEAFALKWEDLDEDGFLSVRRVITKSGEEGRSYEISSDMKTRSSRRRVKLPEFVQDALEEHRTRQAKEMLAAGDDYERRGLIFTRNPQSGEFLYHQKAHREFTKALEKADLPDEEIRLYDLRHTHISRLILDGVDLKLASSRAGHSSIQQTADTYAHLTDEAEEQMADTTEQMLQEAVSR